MEPDSFIFNARGSGGLCGGLLGPSIAQKPAQVVPGANPAQDAMPLTPRILPECPVRLGGVYTSGLGTGPDAGNKQRGRNQVVPGKP